MGLIGKLFFGIFKRIFFSILKKILWIAFIIALVAGIYFYFNPPEEITLFGEIFCIKNCVAPESYCNITLMNEKVPVNDPNVRLVNLKLSEKNSTNNSIQKRIWIDMAITDEKSFAYSIENRFIYHGITFYRKTVNDRNFTSTYYTHMAALIKGIWEVHTSLIWKEGNNTFSENCVSYINIE